MRRQADKLFNARPCLCHGQIFKKGSKLHDESHFPCRKSLPDTQGCDQCDGNKHIRFDVKSSNKPDNCLQYNRNPA